MNRLLWIFGAILTTNACMATMISASTGDKSAGTIITIESTSVPFGVQSLVSMPENAYQELDFGHKAVEAPLSEVWVMAQRSTSYYQFFDFQTESTTAEGCNAYDIQNVATITSLDSQDTLPTLSECLAQSESKLTISDSGSNFGISQLAYQHPVR